ncbi:hypothetical protein BRD13_08235, partial [Halobacteriales archaeon SW_5_70_135]
MGDRRGVLELGADVDQFVAVGGDIHVDGVRLVADRDRDRLDAPPGTVTVGGTEFEDAERAGLAGELDGDRRRVGATVDVDGAAETGRDGGESVGGAPVVAGVE